MNEEQLEAVSRLKDTLDEYKDSLDDLIERSIFSEDEVIMENDYFLMWISKVRAASFYADSKFEEEDPPPDSGGGQDGEFDNVFQLRKVG